MKRLLMNPNNISAPFNTPDPGEDELLFVQMNEFEEKYKEKIPWIMSLSQQLVNQKNKNPEKNIETREHELEPAFHQEPRQPEKPKPSGTSRAAAQFKPLSPDVKKQVQFQAYKSTRPDLLTKLTSMITKGLFDLQRAYENDQKQNNNQIDLNNANSEILTNISQTKFLEEKFLIYSSAFERYIEESTLYKKVLEEIHDAYHEYIYNLQSRFSTGNDITVILERKDQEWQNKIQDMQQLNALKYQVSQETNKLLEKKIYHLENDKQRLENELCKSRESYSVIKKEYDEIRTSCVTLTSGLSRMEEEHRVYQMNETNRLTELSHSKATEQKFAEEIERLQQNLQNMEHIQSNMVNQEVLVTLEGTVESLKAEMKRMETTHRQLLLRYASIKSVVDECFKKWETENSSCKSELSILVIFFP
jgi:chromosome segregation ATPase